MSENKNTDETKKKSKLPQKIAMIILLVLSANFATRLFNKPSAEKEIAELVDKTNKTLPKMVNPEIRMDSVGSSANHVRYNMTFVNIEKNNIDVETLKTDLQRNLLTDLKSNPGMAAFREHHIAMSYSYYDKNKDNLCKLTFTAEQYTASEQN
jgi:hypothetical protein